MPTILIIGASRGLGFALAEEHLKRGWQVIASVRATNTLEPLAATYGAALEVITLDSTDWPAVDVVRGALATRTLDVLLVNAGISGPHLLPIGEVDAEPFTELMLTNALAPLRLVDRFADLVPADGIVAVMSSELGSIENNRGAMWEAYRMSKAALDMGLRSVAARRAAEGRTYLALCPGWVRTDLGGPGAVLSIEQSIPRLTDVLERRRGSGGVAMVTYEDKELPW